MMLGHGHSLVDFTTPHDRVLQVVRIAARAAGCAYSDITGRCRRKPVVVARWAVMAALRDGLGWSTNRIGARLHLDHTTVMHGLARHAELAAQDAGYAALSARLLHTLKGGEHG